MAMPDPQQNSNLHVPSAKEAQAISPPPARGDFEHDAGARSGSFKSGFWVAFILTAAAVASAIGTGAFGARYVVANWRILNAARQELYNLEKQHKEISDAAIAMRRLEPEFKFINSSFVDPASPLPFIESMEALGRKTGVEVELSLSAGPDNTQNYTLTAAGEFRQIMSFFKNLELLPFWFELQDSEISAVAKKDENGNKTAKPKSSVRLNILLKPFAP